MRISSFVFSRALLCVLACPLAVTACGGDDGGENEPFATLQDCYAEHHQTESFSIHDSIVVCCLEHPIGGVHPSCGSTAAECVDHVDLEIDDTTVTSADIDAACTTYIDEM